MFSRRFALDMAERCVRAAVVSMIAALGTGAVGLTNMPWLDALNLAGAAAALSLLGSLAATGVGPSDSASVLYEVGSK
jgi:hypothetical protein